MIFSRRPLLVVLACAFALAPLGAAAKAKKPAGAAGGQSSSAGGVYKGYIVVDAATGRTLAEDHADEVSPPASMTKLMTFAVLYDKLSAGQITLATPVQINRDDARMGGTQVYLDPRETYPVEELIYAMMIQSANDAAHALARASAGSVDAFVAQMNNKARELGMTHTTFRSPHGLPPASRRIAEGDLTSPRDFAILCRYLVQKTNVLKYSSVKIRKFGEGVRTPDKVITMVNHDHLLNVAGVDGLKTGYTEGAGYCLSSTAQRNGHRLVAVIMGSFGTGGQIDKGRARDRKMSELLENSFANLPAGTPTFAAAPEATPPPSPITSAPLTAEEKSAASAGEPMVKFPAPSSTRR